MNTETLSSHEVFGYLQPEQVDAISDVSEVISLQDGEVVFCSGEAADYLYAVLDGQVSLELPRGGGVSLHIEDLARGALFGSCVCFDLRKYTMTARCAGSAELLRISADKLKQVMEEDPATGYQVQRMISRTYFKRYLGTMGKLQTVAEALAVRVG
jgi:CRP-like cAMP-binding protein